MKAPAFVAALGQGLPLHVISLPFAAGLELARRLHWLTPPPELNGRRFALHITDLGLQCCFGCAHGGFHPLLKDSSELQLRASLADFLLLLQGHDDADTLFFQRRLGISGDTELGLIVKNWLDATERPAWLARLSKVALHHG